MNKKNIRSWILYGIMTPCCVAASTGFALLLQPMIDAAVQGQWALFWRCSFCAIALGFVSVGLEYGVNSLSAGILTVFTRNLRNEYMNDILQKTAKDYFSRKSSFYVSKLTVASQEIAEKYCGSLLEIYRIFWSFLFSMIAIIYGDGKLAILVVMLAAVSVNLPKLFQRQADLAEKDYLESNDSCMAETQNILSCFLLVKVFGMFQTMQKKYSDKTEAVREKGVRRKQKQYLIQCVSSGFTQLSFILMVIFVMLLVMKGKVSIGYVMSMTQLMGGVMAPFETLPLYLMTYRTGKKEYENTFEKEKRQQPARIPAQKIPENPVNWLEMKQVTFGYQENAPIMRDISLSLDMKKKYAVVGGSGEGKSTIAKLLMGFLTPQEGEIRINGIDIRQVREEELFAWLSYQEQHVAMLDDTIENNILLQRRVSKKQWQEVLQKSHVEEILTRNSFGEETQVGEHGKNLSGGERQRIGLARSLLSDTKFLIFDEPTASLDNENALQIEKNILSLSGIGALVITHRVPVEIMERYDEIFVLDQGKIVEKGTCQELLQQQGKFYHLVYGRESVSPS